MKITKVSEFTDFVGRLIRISMEFETPTSNFTVKLDPEVVNAIKPYVGNGLSITLFDGEKKFEYQG
ncbi:hypothetical protein, partial [Streptomyces sp. P17]|uniref:hypothetical protein n=1 Tax=Streptomyces sp. P17 TaxID=3074716 RepID=UPI0028F4234A